MKKIKLQEAIERMKKNEETFLIDLVSYYLPDSEDIGLNYWFEIHWNQEKKEIEILNIRRKNDECIATEIQGEYRELFQDETYGTIYDADIKFAYEF